MYLFTWYIYWKTILCSQKTRTYSPNYVIFMCSAVLRNHLEASLAIWVYLIGPLAITQRFNLRNIFLGFFLNTSNLSFGLGLLDYVLFSFVFSSTPKFLLYTIFFFTYFWGWRWVRGDWESEQFFMFLLPHVTCPLHSPYKSIPCFSG